jgi:tetratricopeptide (TPR) repeat protein
MKKVPFWLIFLMMLACCQSSSYAQTITEIEKLYGDGKYEQVIEEVSILLKNEPENCEYNLVLGRALTDTQQFEEAIPYLKKANVFDKNRRWIKAWALFYLGSCYYATGNYAEAKRSLAECIKLNATKNVTNSALYLNRLFGFNEFFNDAPVIESEHFIFHFQHSTKVKDMKLYVQEREEAFQRINQFFKSNLPQKINFYVYNSDADIKKATSIAAGFAKPELCLIHSRYFQSIGHEMTHILTYYYDQPTKETGFINEGIAVYFDQTNQDKMELAKTILKQKGIKHLSIVELWNNGNFLIDDDSYPLAGAFVKYLIDCEGEEKFRSIIADQSYQNAKAVYGDRLDRLIKNFEEALLID